ncbi:arabinose efflux permease family protein [Hoeflea sp. IMCC20628]|uniref:MFS transporter n=1 Tax=Hoeflea sp. IMCC20628 TaxID=1620421 RepID=UPI00063BDA22|nr:MFS transporter [Hoeflea sp. IMCC20628]AKI02635.1 arabinose efflux permease family protein [Hoeflea sp. IMCC20628]
MSLRARRVEPLTLLIGISMTIGYGTLYYPFAILGPEIARAEGWSNSFVFGVFSAALLTSAVTASLVGRAMDRFGARPVMVVGSCLAALTLFNLSHVQSMAGFAIAMLLIEFSARMVQYETGFAALTALHGRKARRPIAHVTLIAGFASTVFWPLIHWLLGFMDWRGVCLILAAINLLVALPIHAMIPRRPGRGIDLAPSEPVLADPGLLRPGGRTAGFVLMAVAFSGSSFLMSAVHTSFFLILQEMGREAALAALAGAVIGPMQVAARMIEMLTGERVSSSVVGVISSAALLLGVAFLAAALWFDGDLIVIVFAVSFGIGQGLNFIARAILPARLFGTVGYGALTGNLATIRLFAMAGAPICSALAITHAGIGATFTLFGLMAVIGVLAACGLQIIEKRAAAAQADLMGGASAD